jgi:hypothetical protein
MQGCIKRHTLFQMIQLQTEALFNLQHDRQCTYNVTLARSCNHCCSGTAISITYCECVFVTLGIQHEMRMRYIVNRNLPRYTIFFHIISYTAPLKKKRSYSVQNVYFDFLYTFRPKHFSFQEEMSVYDKKCSMFYLRQYKFLT